MVAIIFWTCVGFAQAPDVLVPDGAIWRYLDDGSDRQTAWRGPDFEDVEWNSGPAKLGFGFQDVATPLQPGWITYYFRHEFQVPAVSEYTNLHLWLKAKAGAVVYLNGAEVYRENMPPGEIRFDTRAQFSSQIFLGDSFHQIMLPSSVLAAGRNAFAVEVHQDDEARQLAFDLKFERVTNELLSIRIAAPDNGQFVRRGSDVPLEAILELSPTPPVTMQFFASTNLLGEDSTAPYSMVWSNVPLGEHWLEAVATPIGGGVSATSPPVTLTAVANFPPTVSLTTSGNLFPIGADITLSATATDSDGFITRMEFFTNGMKLTESTNASHSFVWTNVAAGDYIVTAVVTDNDGWEETSNSETIAVRFNLHPAVNITRPRSGAFFNPGDLVVEVAVSDADGFVARIEYYDNGELFRTETDPPFDFNWPDPALGEHTLVAVAIDDGNASTESIPVFFTITTEELPSQLIRGPYVQLARPTSMTVHWRTDKPASSRVRHGTSQASLNEVVQLPGLRTEHSVTLSNLFPDTIYFYAVGTNGGDMAAGPDFYFQTAPSSPRPLRVWAIGDSGTADAGAAAVRDAYAAHSSGRHTDVWLMLGDNAYGSGSDEHYQEAVFDMYAAMLRKTAVWPTLGNHDTDVGGFVSWFDLPAQGEAGGVPSGSEQYYSFNYGNIHFICLDSHWSGRTTDTPMYSWLEVDLAAVTNEWLIAYWHAPPYTKGTHDSDGEFDLVAMRENFLPLLESYGVDLVLCGHSHVYERSYVLAGHFGFSWELQPEMILDHASGRTDETGPYRKPADGSDAQRGTIYVVTGCSGQFGFGPLDHPVMHSSMGGTPGSLVLDIDGLRLDARFLSGNGMVMDYFTLIKGDSRPVLKVTRDIQGTRLTWPISQPPYDLEQTTGLGPNESWTPVPQIPIHINGENVVPLDPAEAKEFFRLRQRP